MEREKLSENLQTLIPLLHKKLMKGLPAFNIPKQQIGLLFIISKYDERSMSYYSEKMMIPKSNLTVLADKLIEEGFIERVMDLNDRRVTNLKITNKGRQCIKEFKQKVREEMIKKFESLDDNDVKRLNELIEEMKKIFDKIDI